MGYKIMAGVYIIKNSINDMFYIGSSIKIKKRIREHVNMLKNNTHYNKRMQDDWNELGEGYFSFEILEECKESEVYVIEQKYIDRYFNSGMMYNLCPKSDSSLGFKFDEDKKEEMKRLKGKENNPMYGKHHMNSSKRKMRDKNKGIGNGNAKLSEEDVISILLNLKTNKTTLETLANTFDTSVTNISNIKNGKRWGYLKERMPELYE